MMAEVPSVWQKEEANDRMLQHEAVMKQEEVEARIPTNSRGHHFSATVKTHTQVSGGEDVSLA